MKNIIQPDPFGHRFGQTSGLQPFEHNRTILESFSLDSDDLVAMEQHSSKDAPKAIRISEMLNISNGFPDTTSIRPLTTGTLDNLSPTTGLLDNSSPGLLIGLT